MFAHRLGILFALLLCFLVIVQPTVATTSISSSPSTNDVTVDGKWTTAGEWDNATELQARGGAGYVRIKDDGQFLYILIDFTSDTTLDEKDMARVRFDVNNDKANRPQTDDYMILADWNGGTLIQRTAQGNGRVWTAAKQDLGAEVASSIDSVNDPYSSQPHMIYEFAIPREVFEDRSEVGFSATVGHRMRTLEAHFINLPRRHHYLNPSTWATLSFATSLEIEKPSTATVTSQNAGATVAPKGVIIIIVVIIVLVAVAIYLKKRKVSKDKVS